MRRREPAGALAVAEKLYGVLLHAYPQAHRREYGPLMSQAFRDLGREWYGRQGTWGLAALWVRLAGDLATSSVDEHLIAWLEGGGKMTKKQHLVAIVCAAFPLSLEALLALMNPGFAGRLFSPSASQPVGWLIAAAVLVLAGLTYLVQRKGWERAGRSSGAGAELARAQAAPRALAASIVLLALPATILVLMGPALVMVLDMGL